jgi:branched-chain amino acid transport system substrate-binding protein
MRSPSHMSVALLVVVLCASGLAACGGDDDGDGATAAASQIDPSKPPVRIPVISIKLAGVDMLTGNVAGAEAAAEKINSEGGFGGREVIVEPCATELQPATATVCANKTVGREGVVAEIGCEVTWGVSGLRIYAKAGIPSLNCLNGEHEFKSEWAFGIHPGASGHHAALAAWLCDQDEVQKVVMLGQDIPQQRRDEQTYTRPIIEGCGKQIDYVFVPIEATDFTPYVNEAVEKDPDFIIVQNSSAPTAQAFKSLQQAGYPAEQAAAVGSATGYETTLELAGDAMEGAVLALGWKPWDDEDDPEVAEYVKAMEGSDADHRASDPQWGYANVMWLYKAAETIGFERFDAKTLTAFMRNETDVLIPLSRTFVNPGPEGLPAMKQPATLMARWQDGRNEILDEGTDEGWVDGYRAWIEATKGSDR